MPSKPGKHMLCSVVIPTFNRPSALKKCLIALTEQSYTNCWEVIVVDDGGHQDLRHLIKDFEDCLNISLIRQDNKGPATARNTGVREAKGEFIAFLDDDCEPETYWLASLYSNTKPNTVAGGKTQNKLIHNSFSDTSQRLVSFLYKEWEGSPWYFFTSNNFMVHRQTFLDIGGFDESFPTSAGEDREFCARWIHSGHEMEYVPTALVNHAHGLKFLSFWKMHFKYGKAAYLFWKKSKQLGVNTLKPRTSFYLRLFGFVTRRTGSNLKKKASMFFLVLVSQVAALFGFTKAKLEHCFFRMNLLKH